MMWQNLTALESQAADERIALIGRLWDSLGPAAAVRVTAAGAAEIDRGEAQADADPEAGIPCAALRDEPRDRVR